MAAEDVVVGDMHEEVEANLAGFEAVNSFGRVFRSLVVRCDSLSLRCPRYARRSPASTVGVLTA